VHVGGRQTAGWRKSVHGAGEKAARLEALARGVADEDAQAEWLAEGLQPRGEVYLSYRGPSLRVSQALGLCLSLHVEM
jgi:hypothetical protein